MTSKKKRMSMLDSLANASPPAPSMMSTNRALRSARDAVDTHKVWDLEPDMIDVAGRINDRLDPNDVIDLRDAIEANGQTVPILVRRHPEDENRYLLVYGYRRLVAIQQSDKVDKVRALIANLDDHAAQRAQISENMARRDLSYIEKALFARQLVDQGFGTQTDVAEVLTVPKSAISMALGILDMVGIDLARAIGPAHGIGRPRWESLGKAVEQLGPAAEDLIDIAGKAYARSEWSGVLGEELSTEDDPSRAAFESVYTAVQSRIPAETTPSPAARKPAAKPRRLRLNGSNAGQISRTAKGLRLDITEGAFADWLDANADTLLTDLHARWQRHAEDPEQ